MFLTCIIPNSIYLPEGEATPDLRRCSVPVCSDYTGECSMDRRGVTFLRNALAFEDSTEVATLRSVSYLFETLQEGLAEANGKAYDQFDESMLTPHTIDFVMYQWLKQAVAYSRVGLTAVDEDNPTLEVFVVTADTLNDWD